MLIKHQRSMNLGLLLGLTFLGVLALIFSPIFGGGKNGLEYSDALFNKLAKGSSYFVPELTASLTKFQKEELAVNVKMENPDQAARAVKIFTRAAPDTKANGAELNIKGNLSKLLGAVLEDSSSMYFNKGGEVREKYGMDEQDVMTTWWAALNRTVKELQKSGKTEQSNIVVEVMRKGV